MRSRYINIRKSLIFKLVDYFEMSENKNLNNILKELKETVEKELKDIAQDYGVSIEYFSNYKSTLFENILKYIVRNKEDIKAEWTGSDLSHFPIIEVNLPESRPLTQNEIYKIQKTFPSLPGVDLRQILISRGVSQSKNILNLNVDPMYFEEDTLKISENNFKHIIHQYIQLLFDQKITTFNSEEINAFDKEIGSLYQKYDPRGATTSAITSYSHIEMLATIAEDYYSAGGAKKTPFDYSLLDSLIKKYIVGHIYKNQATHKLILKDFGLTKEGYPQGVYTSPDGFKTTLKFYGIGPRTDYKLTVEQIVNKYQPQLANILIKMFDDFKITEMGISSVLRPEGISYGSSHAAGMGIDITEIITKDKGRCTFNDSNIDAIKEENDLAKDISLWLMQRDDVHQVLTPWRLNYGSGWIKNNWRDVFLKDTPLEKAKEELQHRHHLHVGAITIKKPKNRSDLVNADLKNTEVRIGDNQNFRNLFQFLQTNYSSKEFSSYIPQYPNAFKALAKYGLHDKYLMNENIDHKKNDLTDLSGFLFDRQFIHMLDEDKDQDSIVKSIIDNDLVLNLGSDSHLRSIFATQGTLRDFVLKNQAIIALVKESSFKDLKDKRNLLFQLSKYAVLVNSADDANFRKTFLENEKYRNLLFHVDPKNFNKNDAAVIAHKNFFEALFPGGQADVNAINEFYKNPRAFIEGIRKDIEKKKNFKNRNAQSRHIYNENNSRFSDITAGIRIHLRPLDTGDKNLFDVSGSLG